MLTYIVLVVASFIAAAVNAIAGGGTFLVYPALLFYGTSSIVSNATTTMVIWIGTFSTVPGFREEIKNSSRWIKILAVPLLVGGVIGGFALTHTNPDTFAIIAPILIIFGTLTMLFQKHIDRFFLHIKIHEKWWKLTLIIGLSIAVAAYGAYFGAGQGILFLGCISILGITNMHEKIALKNVNSLIVNTTAIVYFLFAHVIYWPIIPLMGISSVAGGFTGAHMVRRIDGELVRKVICVVGFTIAIVLLYKELTR